MDFSGVYCSSVVKKMIKQLEEEIWVQYRVRMMVSSSGKVLNRIIIRSRTNVTIHP